MLLLLPRGGWKRVDFADFRHLLSVDGVLHPQTHAQRLLKTTDYFITDRPPDHPITSNRNNTCCGLVTLICCVTLSSQLAARKLPEGDNICSWND